MIEVARRDSPGELLLTGSLLVLYVSLRGTARALGALEAGVRPLRVRPTATR